MKKDLLIVVDMVNGFVEGGALADKNIHRIVPNIISKIEQAKKNGTPIIAFKDSHTMEDEEFKIYPPHCLKGSWESELIDELKPYEKDMIIIEKNTTNGFNTEKMQQILKTTEFGKIDITGCCTDICVYDLSQSLLKYFAKNGIKTEIDIDEASVDTFGGEGHNADKVNIQTLAELHSLGVNVCYDRQKDYFKPVKVEKMTDSRFLNMFRVTFKGDKGEIKYEMVTRNQLPEVIKPSVVADAVNIIPYSYVGDKTILHVIREFRYPVGEYIYAVPAGLIEKGEDALESAKREIQEEIGGKVINIERSETASYSSAGMTDEKIETFEAEVEFKNGKLGKQELDENEKIDVISLPMEDVEQLLDRGKWGLKDKLGLRSFINKQKVKKLEKEVNELKSKLDEQEKE